MLKTTLLPLWGRGSDRQFFWHCLPTISIVGIQNEKKKLSKKIKTVQMEQNSCKTLISRIMTNLTNLQGAKEKCEMIEI